MVLILLLLKKHFDLSSVESHNKCEPGPPMHHPVKHKNNAQWGGVTWTWCMAAAAEPVKSHLADSSFSYKGTYFLGNCRNRIFYSNNNKGQWEHFLFSRRGKKANCGGKSFGRRRIMTGIANSWQNFAAFYTQSGTSSPDFGGPFIYSNDPRLPKPISSDS